MPVASKYELFLIKISTGNGILSYISKRGSYLAK